MTDDIKDEENIGTIAQSPVVIHSQYLKDLSFENPNAPEILYRADTAPEVDIDVAIDMQKLDHATEEYYYEVVLTINASAKRNDKTMFLAEIKYGATVSIQDLAEPKHHPILFIEVPRMIFPFARMILSNSTQMGGFTPLQMALVNFRAMYIQRFGQKQEQIEAEKPESAE